MFREMRRKKQLLSNSESIEILTQATSGVLGLSGDDEYPYSVPMSYVFDRNKIYFHSAKCGHKIDAVKKCHKASFCVIAQDKKKKKKYTTYYKSVIVFGTIRILETENEIKNAIEKLTVKYHPQASKEGRDQTIMHEWKSLCMLEMTIEHITGKAAIEIVKKQ